MKSSTVIRQENHNIERKQNSSLLQRLKIAILCRKGQGTTEYAILVGVLVVIAIIAIVILTPLVQGLWDNITKNFETIKLPGN